MKFDYSELGNVTIKLINLRFYISNKTDKYVYFTRKTEDKGKNRIYYDDLRVKYNSNSFDLIDDANDTYLKEELGF